MSKRFRPYWFFWILTACIPPVAFTQSTIDPPYHLNGSAYKENCNCYTLTDATNTQSGSVWNMNKILLTSSFEFKFDVNLGCKDSDGADGMVFMLQPISTNIGSQGGGIGYQNVRPSIAIEIDTWQNQENNDPAFDHISIQRDGIIQHNVPNNLAGPVSAILNNNNIEDCQWHAFTIRWDAINKVLSAYIDNQLRVSTTIDLIQDVFNNDPSVYWGFTSATGGANNHQRFCTSLKAGFQPVPSLETCAPQEIQLADLSTSFGYIVAWHWNYGDGTIYNQKTPPPHTYSQPGNYTVSAAILGNDGCWSDTFRQVITIGSIPEPDFLLPDTICGSTIIHPVDQSTVEYGTITEWNWLINGQSFTGESPPEVQIAGPAQVPVQLNVKTKEGCESQTVEKIVHLLDKPEISLASPISATCVGDESELEAFSNLASNPVTDWEWNSLIGAADENRIRLFSNSAGDYPIQLRGLGENGCWSDPVQHIASFFQTKAAAGRDTIAAINQPIQLSGSGGQYYNWSPAGAFSDPNLPNPVVTLDRPTTLVLTTFTDIGCATVDSLYVRVFKGPDLYIPNAFTPNGDGKNDRFAFLAIGMKKVDYFRIYNRLGQLIHEGLNTDGWDGTLRGTPQPAGTYVWMISGEDYNGNVYRKKGSFQLLR
ncbi:lectin-like domain-containing protein [Flavihumibacter sp. UBA7668]|uniref:lectin-like domain-containing protein n=1 Tax=Flavihumibacter sp. UBA7668 TaxID=1946542 RepID=UPI0025C52D12|nr:gliding motility-associated C-terminal domain-containing protein [Flavihumibacter sp. UBA7668]